MHSIFAKHNTHHQLVFPESGARVEKVIDVSVKLVAVRVTLSTQYRSHQFREHLSGLIATIVCHLSCMTITNVSDIMHARMRALMPEIVQLNTPSSSSSSSCISKDVPSLPLFAVALPIPSISSATTLHFAPPDLASV